MARRTQKKPKTQEVLKDTTTQEVASDTDAQQEPKTQEVAKGSGTQEIQSENSVQDAPKIQDDFFLSAAQEKQQQFIEAIYSGIITIDDKTNAIVQNGKPLPQLDPTNPAFDAEKYNFYMDTIKAAAKDAKKDLEKLARQIITPEAAAAIVNTAKEAQQLIDSVLQSVKAFTESSVFKALSDSFKASEQLQKEVQEVAEEWQRLRPYMEEVLQDPKYNGITLDELMTDPDHFEYDDILEEVFEAAKALKADKEKSRQLPQIKYNDSGEVKTSTDKFANTFFSLLAPARGKVIDGQREFIPVAYERRGAKKEISLLYDYSINEAIVNKFGLSNKFDDECFFVTSILDNLKAEGNTTVTATKIWHEMGNTGSPNSKQLTELVKILRLGAATTLNVDMSEVIEDWHIKLHGTSKELISPIMPIQIINEKKTANNETTEAYINIMGYSPFYLVSEPLERFTTWKKEVLRLYTGRRTSRFYSVLRFLMIQIGWLRNPKSKRDNKILFSTLYDFVGAKSSRAQQLTKEMMYRLLNEVFIPTGYVKSYKETEKGEKPGVKLTVTKNANIAKRKTYKIKQK